MGTVVGAITNSLKTLGKGVGNGMKDLSKKAASLLTGLIGLIVSFHFKTTGQAISFLAEHTWLLILVVVAFQVEQYVKKTAEPSASKGKPPVQSQQPQPQPEFCSHHEPCPRWFGQFFGLEQFATT